MVPPINTGVAEELRSSGISLRTSGAHASGSRGTQSLSCRPVAGLTAEQFGRRLEGPFPSSLAHLRVRGEIMGWIRINQNWLRFPYVFTFSRPRYLHPHPYAASFVDKHSQPQPDPSLQAG
eukprot:COSAG01_NODE_1875_length_8997_cov_11.927624_10_plen_121_part_00